MQQKTIHQIIITDDGRQQQLIISNVISTIILPHDSTRRQPPLPSTLRQPHPIVIQQQLPPRATNIHHHHTPPHHHHQTTPLTSHPSTIPPKTQPPTFRTQPPSHPRPSRLHRLHTLLSSKRPRLQTPREQTRHFLLLVLLHTFHIYYTSVSCSIYTTSFCREEAHVLLSTAF